MGDLIITDWVTEIEKVIINSNEIFYRDMTCTDFYRYCGGMYRVILSVLDPRKCKYLKDYSLDFEHAYMTTYLAS